LANNKQGNPVFTFPYATGIFEWNIKENEITYHPFKSCIVDTVLPIPYKGLKISITNFKFSHLSYDHIRKMFYLIAFPSKAYKDIIYATIVLDSNYNIIGEGINTGYADRRCIYEKNRIALLDFNRDGNAVGFFYTTPPTFLNPLNCDSIKAVVDSDYSSKLDVLQQLDKCQINLSQQNFGISVKPLIDSIFGTHYDSLLVVFLHDGSGCPSCFYAMIDFVQSNRDWLKSKDEFYLVILSNNPAVTVNKLKKWSLQELEKQIIIKPSEGTDIYFLESHNPRYVWMKNSKIVIEQTERKPYGTEEFILKHYGIKIDKNNSPLSNH